MALFGSLAWQSGKSKEDIIKAAVAGCCCGVFGWILCGTWLSGALGGIVLAPVAFSATIGLAVSFYFGKEGSCVLLIPAIVAGGVIGHALGSVAFLSAFGLLHSVHRVAASFFSLSLSVAVQAFFMHLACQRVHSALPAGAAWNPRRSATTSPASTVRRQPETLGSGGDRG